MQESKPGAINKGAMTMKQIKAKARSLLKSKANPRLEPFPTFRDVFQSDLGQYFLEKDENTIPLNIVGHLFNHIGNCILNSIKRDYNKRVFYPLTEAVEVMAVDKNEFLVKCRKYKPYVQTVSKAHESEETTEESKKEERSPSLELKQNKEEFETIYFRAKKVVLAGGGRQNVPDDVKLLGIKPKVNKNFFTSDEVCKKQGFFRLLNYIKDNKVKEISIIGGSHSGLACAWMLLNGSAMHDYDEKEEHKFNMDFFDPEKHEDSCMRPDMPAPKGNRKYKTMLLGKNSEQSHIFSELGEEFEYEPWHVGGLLSHPEFSNMKIKIIYKNDIKVNYKSKEDALKDGYGSFSQAVINSKGVVYPFTGLRGDAKELWRKIKILRTEKRVEFERADSHLLQKKAIKNSKVVIWACGYESKPLPIVEYNSLTNKTESIEFKRIQNSQYEVDDTLRLIPKNLDKKYNIFGIGLGYSLKTSNKHIKAEKSLNSRADGVRLYVHIVPFILFQGLTAQKKNMTRGLKCIGMNRATSTQRTLFKTYGKHKNSKRVSSVNKNSRIEITTIEEVPSRGHKFLKRKDENTKTKRNKQNKQNKQKKTKASKLIGARRKTGAKDNQKQLHNYISPDQLKSPNMDINQLRKVKIASEGSASLNSGSLPKKSELEPQIVSISATMKGKDSLNQIFDTSLVKRFHLRRKKEVITRQT